MNEKLPSQSGSVFSLPKALSYHGVIVLLMLFVLKLILARFMIYLEPGFKVLDFSYLPGAVAGTLFGPWIAMLFAIPGDIAGYFVINSLDPYFWGYTLSAMAANFVYGSLLYSPAGRPFWVLLIRALVARLLVVFIVFLGMNALWRMTTHGVSFSDYITGERLLNNMQQLPLHGVCMAVFGWIAIVLRRIFYESRPDSP